MPHDNVTILTVDDEETIRNLFAIHLERFGYRVEQAEDGETGLEIFHRTQPALVLIDLDMPGMGGLEFIEKLGDQTDDTPVIVVSGTGDMDDVIESMHLGAWDYIVKPIPNMSLLRHAIERALERSRLIEENHAYQHHLEDMVAERTKELREANRELMETRLQIIRRLGKAAEYRDNETGRHVVRVSLYSEILARTLEMEAQTTDLIYQASPMHDIGKIGVPDSILRKPGALDLSEWEFMKQHTDRGRDLLSPWDTDEMDVLKRHTVMGHDILSEHQNPLLQMAADIAANHHEHWDGSGYPEQLEGENIPVSARIVAVADVYDALSSKRPYKEPFPPEECTELIRKATGSHFDPTVVAAFEKSLDDFDKIRLEWSD